MNWDQFKAPVFHVCHLGSMVTSLSPTQEVAGSNKLFIQNVANSVKKTFLK